MHVLITGASGIAGRFISARLETLGHRVTSLGRNSGDLPWNLADTRPDLPDADAIVHCAFHHRPGFYRGGEGDDPETFMRLNLTGSLALFEAARRRNIDRIVLISSRAVYGDHRRGEILREDDPIAPNSLYGQMKVALEDALRDRPDAAILRATGIYGRPPGSGEHKWSSLFRDYLAGCEVAARCGSEIHGDDLADAVARVLTAVVDRLGRGIFNASDILLDRRELLAGVQSRTGCPHALPPEASPPPPGIMATERLRALGWRPGGQARLSAFLDAEFGRAPDDQGPSDHHTSGSQPIQSP